RPPRRTSRRPGYRARAYYSYARRITQMRQMRLCRGAAAGIETPMPTHIRVTAGSAGVATITLARPEKKNALSIALRDEVSDALDGLGCDPTVKAIVITGAGDVFSAG